MYRNRLLILAAVIGMMVPIAASPAAAWEFSMDGAFTWEYEFRTQVGKHGFFGPYDVDNGSGYAVPAGLPVSTFVYNTANQPVQVQVPAPIAPAVGTFAPLNFWLGFHYPGNDQNLFTRGSSFSSGSDGAWNTIYMDTNMQIRMNQALRIRGRYHIGKWFTPGSSVTLGEPAASEYLNYHAPGVQRSFSPGYWNTLWLTAELPWGIVTIGKRASAWGTGLGWNGEENRSSESLAFTVPYGPFRFQVSMYPARRGTASLATPSYYNQDFDKNNDRRWDMVLPMFTYRSGPMDMGVLLNWVQRHSGPEGLLEAPGTAAKRTAFVDFDEFYGGVYFKYNDGRFFFNGEVDWDHQMSHRRAVASYREHWRAAAVTGMFSGPAKVSLLYAWLSGPDRRNGRQIDRTGLNTDVGIRSNSWSNTGFFRPYSYLMVYSYGLGTHMNADTTNGTAEDASIWAGRVDYAVASNLNVYGNFMWADRTNKSGYGWGFIRPYTGPYANEFQNPLGTVRWNDRNNAPNIPDPN
ncbi:MAG: hypothetical protein QG577_1258, partial [Thermodesulfobacteriota bacterium]|nr:hypothetical protein [Thermodesulfobacteriota bacterium]